jgi:hypothetical protein
MLPPGSNLKDGFRTLDLEFREGRSEPAIADMS